MKIVLVTGASGYIGRHACHALKDAGYIVWGLDLPSREPLSGITERWFATDIDARAAEPALIGADAILHLAAYTSVEHAEQNPPLYYRNNVSKSARMIDLWLEARLSTQRPFVFASSAAVYGEPDPFIHRRDGRGMLAETNACRPTNAYGRSKLHVEHILDDYGRAFGLPWAALRFFNVAGAWPERGLGEEHEPETHLLPRLIRASRTDETITVYGRQHATLDGTCERDYVHVRDVADACVLTLKALFDEQKVGAVNIGSGVGTSVMSAILAVEGETGRALTLNHEPTRRGDVARLVADIEKAEKVLGWKPKQSSLGNIVKDAVAYAFRDA